MRQVTVIALLAFSPFAQLFCCCMVDSSSHCSPEVTDVPACHAEAVTILGWSQEELAKTCSCETAETPIPELVKPIELQTKVISFPLQTGKLADSPKTLVQAEIRATALTAKVFFPPGPSRSALACFLI